VRCSAVPCVCLLFSVGRSTCAVGTMRAHSHTHSSHMHQASAAMLILYSGAAPPCPILPSGSTRHAQHSPRDDFSKSQ